MELVDPLLVYLEQHQRVRISQLIVHALEFARVDWVITASIPEDRPCLSVNRTDVDGLLHALESHTEEEDSSDL